MNQFRKTLIYCFSIYGFIALCLLLFGDKEKFSMIGLSGLLLAVGYFLIGVISIIFSGGRKVGQAMLLAAGIILLIGISICSIAPLTMNMH